MVSPMSFDGMMFKNGFCSSATDLRWAHYLQTKSSISSIIYFSALRYPLKGDEWSLFKAQVRGSKATWIRGFMNWESSDVHGQFSIRSFASLWLRRYMTMGMKLVRNRVSLRHCTHGPPIALSGDPTGRMMYLTIPIPSVECEHPIHTWHWPPKGEGCIGEWFFGVHKPCRLMETEFCTTSFFRRCRLGEQDPFSSHLRLWLEVCLKLIVWSLCRNSGSISWKKEKLPSCFKLVRRNGWWCQPQTHPCEVFKP